MEIDTIAYAKQTGHSLLDEKNIVWKISDDGQWLGKRSVLTLDGRACWLERTTPDNVKSWWCGKDADYNEIFYGRRIGR